MEIRHREANTSHSQITSCFLILKSKIDGKTSKSLFTQGALFAFFQFLTAIPFFFFLVITKEKPTV